MLRALLFSAFLAFASAPSFAQAVPPLVIDWSTVLLDQEKKPIIDNSEGKCAGVAPAEARDCLEKLPKLTLGAVAVHSLLRGDPSARAADPEQSWKQGTLAMRIQDGKVASLTSEQVTLLKRLIGLNYGPLIVARTWPLIDPAVLKDEK